MEHFTGGRYSARRKLNNMLRDIDAFKHITGSDLINIQRTLSGPTVGLNFGILQQRLPKAGGSTGGIHIAFCKQYAPSGNNIPCYLDVNESGDEILVYCIISGGTRLNRCTPYLTTGMPLLVKKGLYGDNPDVWWCTFPFHYWTTIG